MVKNEQNRIRVTLESVLDKVDGVLILDTGSTDETISVVRECVLEHEGKRLDLLNEEFIDFSTTRNVMLDFLDKTDYTHILLLDSNDEVRCSRTQLRELAEQSEASAFMFQQEWYTGTDTINYFNIRMIRNKKQYRYKGSVHEYLECRAEHVKVRDVIIYQNRVLDNDGKTKTRWEKDLILLKKDLKKTPTCSRTQFYLAQTYDCMGNEKKAFNFYKIRAENKSGFWEERFNAMMKCAKYEKTDDKKIYWCFQALELSERVEVFVFLAKLFRKKEKFTSAFCFAKMACSLDIPDCLLFIDKKIYTHDRWQEMAISAFYIKEYDAGRNACENAIKSGYDLELNTNNLKFYEETS